MVTERMATAGGDVFKAKFYGRGNSVSSTTVPVLIPGSRRETA